MRSIWSPVLGLSRLWRRGATKATGLLGGTASFWMLKQALELTFFVSQRCVEFDRDGLPRHAEGGFSADLSREEPGSDIQQPHATVYAHCATGGAPLFSPEYPRNGSLVVVTSVPPARLS